ncbi:hypothetical protein NU195Hw_Modified_7t1 [Hortaea werneckii]
MDTANRAILPSPNGKTIETLQVFQLADSSPSSLTIPLKLFKKRPKCVCSGTPNAHPTSTSPLVLLAANERDPMHIHLPHHSVHLRQRSDTHCPLSNSVWR